THGMLLVQFPPLARSPPARRSGSIASPLFPQSLRPAAHPTTPPSPSIYSGCEPLWARQVWHPPQKAVAWRWERAGETRADTCPWAAPQQFYLPCRSHRNTRSALPVTAPPARAPSNLTADRNPLSDQTLLSQFDIP